ncbi:MAG: hypothetical protein IJY27_04660 [Clostridia bacterium]|nr:hypothetical protein [Clostridia bacterium]
MKNINRLKIPLTLILIISLLFGCHTDSPANDNSDSTTPINTSEPPDTVETTTVSMATDSSSQTTIDQPSQPPIETKYKQIENYCPLKWDMPPVLGTTSLTPLAEALVSTSEPNETMYFLVYVYEPLPEDYDNIAVSRAYFNYVYQGKTINEWSAESGKLDVQISNLEKALRDSGMGKKQIEMNEQYLELYARKLYLEEQLIHAQAEQYFHENNEAISKYIKLFEEQGFDIIGDINDSSWQYHLYRARRFSEWYIMFAVSGTVNNIAQLRESNDEYAIWLSASESEGRWIGANIGDDLRGSSFLSGFPDASNPHVCTSYQQLGLYERLWYIEE